MLNDFRHVLNRTQIGCPNQSETAILAPCPYRKLNRQPLQPFRDIGSEWSPAGGPVRRLLCGQLQVSEFTGPVERNACNHVLSSSCNSEEAFRNITGCRFQFISVKIGKIK